jgi:hypothetical protein
MKWISIAIIFLLAFAACSWAQEVSAESGSTAQESTPQIPELSSLPTSLLWQIGSDALQNSLISSLTQGETLSEAQKLQPDLTNWSLEMLATSQRLETKMNGLSLNFGWLSQSMTSFVNTTTQVIKQQEAQIRSKEIELWIWRTVTAAAVIYLILR